MYFPYPSYYPNQQEIIEYLTTRAAAGENAVLESPTGSGKTVAVLSALLPKALEEDKKILYLCRTHEQMDRVMEELKKISKNRRIRGLPFRSRRSLCFNEKVLEMTRSTGEERFVCTILKKEGRCRYYNNIRKGRELRFEGPHTSSEITSMCRGKEICPYETAKENLPDCTVIACSYLYFFDPDIRAAFLGTMGLSINDFILVLDEAHNLPRLAAEIAGDMLTEFAIERAMKEAEDYHVPEAEGLLKGLQSYMEKVGPDEERLEKESLQVHLGVELERLDPLEHFGEEIRKRRLIDGKRPVSLLHSCASFTRYWMESSEEEFAYFTSKTRKGARMLEIISLDPKTITEEPLGEAYLSVHMSGTMTPIDPYCRIIGLKDYSSRSFPSPFPKANITALVDTSVTTLGSQRTKEMYRKIAGRLERTVTAIPGNVLVFFPSYTVLDSVLEEGVRVEKEVYVERSTMTSSENNEMIGRYKRSENSVLYGVQQGRNSEGQDFPGEQASAVVVVGIPYAVKGPKVRAQIEYYKKKYRGFWGRHTLGEYYAYYLPAYRSLNQAAGRAHRRLTDKAAIIFLEKRVAMDKKVLANISPWIRENISINRPIAEELNRFYS